METKTKYIIGSCLVIAILILCCAHPVLRAFRTQHIPLHAVTDGTGETKTDTVTLYPKDKLTIGTTYRVTVTYQMEAQTGHKLFCHKHHTKTASTPVNYRCSPLEMTTTFTAQKEQMSLVLTAGVQPEDITDNNGQILNLKDNKLCPTVTLMPISSDTK